MLQGELALIVVLAVLRIGVCGESATPSPVLVNGFH
jgi:hypothetical protein